ncbi:MAG: DUF2807 domain-containing protein [Bacteroidales bacterium]|jgi:hypothetical protein
MKKYMLTTLLLLVCLWLGATETIHRTYELQPFSYIEASFLYRIEVHKGNTYTMELEIPEDLVNELTIAVSGNTLKLGVTKEWWRTTKNVFHKRYTITGRITVPELEGITLSNAAVLVAKDGFMPANFQIKLSGASHAEVHVITHALNIDMTGASVLQMSGLATRTKAYVNGASSLNYYQETNKMDLQALGASYVVLSGTSVFTVIKASGGSKVRALDFETEEMTVKCQGASTAEIFVTGSLSATSLGASVIRVKGDPVYVKSSTKGASVIKTL